MKSKKLLYTANVRPISGTPQTTVQPHSTGTWRVRLSGWLGGLL